MFTIYQGSNTPIVITIDGEMPTFDELSALLYKDHYEHLKRWSKADVEIEDNTITLPVSENESINFPEGRVILSLKGWDSDGATIFFDEDSAEVVYKEDKVTRG